ncbi:EsaB/YukD family protein [Lactococcus nasutitermitis]|uniref:EsaB/YukD family protein n=1 Tax=Lactococcus nasutitermitis TaxID=1652957 RepID=A0ABV9JCT3_9LACT|nr:EsaB/YukD family protein [Lactococcus nasutitermitis]
MSTQIDISLEFKEQQLDFRVPTEVTMGRLVELMHETLKNARLPEDWTLKLKDKDILVDETDLIKDLPIGNGDVFCIIPLQEKQEHNNESI